MSNGTATPATTSQNPSSVDVDFMSAFGERLITVGEKQGCRANIVWVHGLSDHGARQIDTARWFARHGFRTLTFDLVGHGGRSSKPSISAWVSELYRRDGRAEDIEAGIRSDPRFTAQRRLQLAGDQRQALESASFEDHAKQLKTVLGALPRLLGDQHRLPLFLVGHSMGALIVAESLWRLGRSQLPMLSGAVLLSPALKPQGNPASRAQQVAIEALWSLRRERVSLLRGAAKAALALNLSVDTTWGIPWLSDQAGEVELFRTDPLIPTRLPSRYASSIESQMIRTEARGDAFPVDGLVMLPGRDGITSRDAGMRFARRAIAAVGEEHFRLIAFDRVTAHDLFRSSVRDQARQAMLDWLESKLVAGAALRSVA